MRDARPVVVATFASRSAADVACGALAAEGIDADIIADDASGLHPDLALNRGVNVIVSPPDASEARTVLGMDEDTSRSPGAGNHRQFTKLIAGLLAAAVVLVAVVSVVQTF